MMNRAERRFEMKGNKTNSKREGEKSMKGMNVIGEVREMHKKFTEAFELKGNVAVPDEMVIRIHNLLSITGNAKEYAKLIVLHDNFIDIMRNMLQMVDKFNGSPNFPLSTYFNKNADALAGMYIAVVLTIVKESYAEGILQEIIGEIQEYELSKAAEERMDKICTLVMPEEEVQAIKTFQALLSGNAQSFVDELDRFEAMLGIQR
jgi:hypothetical protein